MRLEMMLCGVAAAAVLIPEAALAKGFAPVSVDDLAGSRGGFVTAGGLTFGLGVQVTTYVDGALALQSTVSFTGDNGVPAGATKVTAPTAPTAPTAATAPTLPTAPTAPTTPTIATLPTVPTVAPAPPAAPAPAAQAPVTPAPAVPVPAAGQAATTSPVVPAPGPTPPAPATPAPVQQAPIPQVPVQQAQTSPGPQPSGPSPPPQTPPADPPRTASTGASAGTIVTLPANTLPPSLVALPAGDPASAGEDGTTSTVVTDDGKTTITHTLTAGQIRNLVVNAADNRVIQQDLQLDIVLPGFAEVQQQNLLSSMGMKINADGGLGVIGALAR
jgi:hypothetical protein